VRNYTEEYVYDAIGNLLSMSHDGGSSVTKWTRNYKIATNSNRLLGTSMPGDTATQFSATYGYDEHGNMVSMPHLASIGWNYRDEMVSADKGGGGVVYFTYDSAGQRVRKVYEHSGLVEERIYLGGYEVYRKRVASSGALTLERQTLHVMDGVRRIALVETKTVDADAGGAFVVSTVVRVQLENHLGSAALEVDADGMVISYEEYHPYGTTAYQAASSAAEVRDSPGIERTESWPRGVGHDLCRGCARSKPSRACSRRPQIRSRGTPDGCSWRERSRISSKECRTAPRRSWAGTVGP
jgi:uncharacterized protein RhaS with RHS repeats